jgi:hypothetical protein
MTQLSGLNEYALDGYLRGEHGELMRQVAGQELYERGQRGAAMTEEEMIAELVSRGYVIYRPDD